MAWLGDGWEDVASCTLDVVRRLAMRSGACVIVVFSCILFRAYNLSGNTRPRQTSARSRHSGSPFARKCDIQPIRHHPHFSHPPRERLQPIGGQNVLHVANRDGIPSQVRFLCVCVFFFSSRLASATVPCLAVLYVFMNCDSNGERYRFQSQPIHSVDGVCVSVCV